jgi:hypothetical protein
MSYQETHEEMRREKEARAETEARQLQCRCTLVSPRSTLFEIGEDAAALDSYLESLGGDISDAETAEIIDDWLRSNTAALEGKVDGYCALIREYSARANVRIDEVKRLRALIDADDSRARQLKERLLRFFEERGIERVETKRFRVSPQTNGGALPLIVDEGVDASALSDEFQRIELDENAVRKVLDLGVALPFARYGDRGRHLRIR